jgi:hypothetical protein
MKELCVLIAASFIGYLFAAGIMMISGSESPILFLSTYLPVSCLALFLMIRGMTR